MSEAPTPLVVKVSERQVLVGGEWVDFDGTKAWPQYRERVRVNAEALEAADGGPEPEAGEHVWLYSPTPR